MPDPASAVYLPLAVGCPLGYCGPSHWTVLLLFALRHPGALVSTHVGNLGGGNRPTEEGDSEATVNFLHVDRPIAKLHCGYVEPAVSIVSFLTNRSS